jgi:hypothetical protein
MAIHLNMIKSAPVLTLVIAPGGMMPIISIDAVFLSLKAIPIRQPQNVRLALILY